MFFDPAFQASVAFSNVRRIVVYLRAGPLITTSWHSCVGIWCLRCMSMVFNVLPFEDYLELGVLEYSSKLFTQSLKIWN